MARILVTGGAGYIGSVVVARLLDAGHAVTLLDNLSTGHRAAALAPLVELDLADGGRLRALFEAERFDGVLHFASRAYVGESVRDPRLYYEENLGNAMRLTGAMLDASVKRLVFSSSCATYGHPVRTPMDESHPQLPINPYGETKLAIERMLHGYQRAYGLESMVLRYFNAAGASLDGRLGESHEPETHLIPLALRATRASAEPLTVFGTDWPTPDGTCVRDYVHVEDLATAHVAALHRLLDGGASEQLNLGTGRGSSVNEVIAAVHRASGVAPRVVRGPRRAGDPPALVADAEKARRVLGFTPKHSDLDTVISTAWRWFSAPKY